MRLPGWFLILVTFSLSPLALYGFFKALDLAPDSSTPTLYHLAAFSFLVPVFALVAWTMGVLGEEGRRRSVRRSSEYRKLEYREQLKVLSGKSSRRRGKEE